MRRAAGSRRETLPGSDRLDGRIRRTEACQMMTLDAFKSSAAADAPPPGLTKPLLALWWAKKGDWEKAHMTAQADKSRDGAWVHGYLHWVEGDLDNSSYWY